MERRIIMAKPTEKWIYNEDQADICGSCGNAYQILHLKPSDNYNDFGYRHCPFCGALAGELANMKAA